MFELEASCEEFSQALIIRKSSLFKRLSITFVACEDPLAWWYNQKRQFLNVAFLAKQIFNISRSQIEIEKMFNLVKVLMSLQQHHLQMENVLEYRHLCNNVVYKWKTWTKSSQLLKIGLIIHTLTVWQIKT
jgi:hypothetical protein